MVLRETSPGWKAGLIIHIGKHAVGWVNYFEEIGEGMSVSRYSEAFHRFIDNVY